MNQHTLTTHPILVVISRLVAPRSCRLLATALLITSAMWAQIDKPSTEVPTRPAASRPTDSQPTALTLKAEVDTAVAVALETRNTPGAVVYVGRGAETLLFEAYGSRCLVPTSAPMEKGTRFDCASLTKAVATATSVLRLVDEGKVNLNDPVAKYVLEFGINGKHVITVKQLLQHRGALIADNPLSDYDKGPSVAWERIVALPMKAAPGTTAIYSDVGYIVLGKLVERVDGRSLDRFAEEQIFKPLGMKQTGFLPSAESRALCAATEKRGGRMLQGEVHDPRAHALGGVAGHAGLFSTAEDLGIWCRMVLGRGEVNGIRILKKDVASLFLTADTLPNKTGPRTIGLDADPKNAARGDLFPAGSSYGHTGFTGTSLWLDPASKGFVITLSSRLHPDGKGDAKDLRRAVVTAAARTILKS